MQNHPHSASPRHSKTATAAADPVLVRLATAGGATVLLAEDVTYDQAGVMTFHQVRWVRPRRGVSAVLRRHPAAGRHDRVVLRQVNGRIMGYMPSVGWLTAPTGRRGFAMRNIAREQYLAYCAATPRRLLIAGQALVPPVRRVARVTLALHRLRFALRKAMPRLAV